MNIQWMSWMALFMNIINCAAMGRARFLIYPWFIFYFLFFCHVGQLNQTSLGQSSNDVTCVDLFNVSAKFCILLQTKD